MIASPITDDRSLIGFHSHFSCFTLVSFDRSFSIRDSSTKREDQHKILLNLFSSLSLDSEALWSITTACR